MANEENLATVRRKYVANRINIKNKLQRISNICFENDKTQQKFEENSRRISELTKEVDTLKEEYGSEKQNLEKKMHAAEEQNNILQALKQEKVNLDVSLVDLKAKHKNLKTAKPSIRDERLLERGKRKLKLYKEFTCVRWDYSAPENVFQGYITNKKDFLQKIVYKSDINFKSLRESLWKDIHKSTFPPKTIVREGSKENLSANN